MKRLVPLAAILALAGCSTVPGGYSGGGLINDDGIGQIAPVDSYDTLTLGTTVEWTPDPSQARHRARSEDRLLLVLHLSGDFESFEGT